MKRKDMDMVNGSLGDKIIRYTIPLALTAILQQLFNAADLAVVGRFSGKEAMAAVGSNAPITGLLVNLFIGISLGSNVIIARSIGQKKEKQVSDAVHTSILVSLLGGLLIFLMGELAANGIIGYMDAPADVFPMAVRYLRIYLLGMPVIFLYNFESAIFRSCGNTKTPLMALAFSGILNVGLNLFFVLVCKMKVEGVAIATVLSNAVSSMILFAALLKTKLVVRVDVRKLKIHFSILSEILKIGVPAGVQSMVFSLANLVIQSAINSLGTTVIAASAAGLNLELFACFVLTSFGQACTTFVGQNYGAGKNERCVRTLKLCILQSAIGTATACCLILLFSRQLLSIFNTDPEVISIGRIRLQYIFFAYGFSFLQEVLSGYLRGFGISLAPACCAVLGICGVRLLWIFTVFKKYPSFPTIMKVYPLSLGTTAAIILLITLMIRPEKRYKISEK